EQLVENAPAFARNLYWNRFALQPACRFEIGTSRSAERAIEGHRRPDIRGAQHLFAFRDDAEERYREDFEHIVDREHLAARRAPRIIAGDQEVLVDAFAALGLLSLRI